MSPLPPKSPFRTSSAIPFRIPIHEGDRVVLDGQPAEVAFVTPDAVMFFSDPPPDVGGSEADGGAAVSRADPASASPLGEGAKWLSHGAVFEAWKRGSLILPPEPVQDPTIRSPEEVLRVCSSKAAGRLAPKLVFVHAAEQLLQELGVKPTRAWINANERLIYHKYLELERAAACEERERQGLKRHSAAKLDVVLAQRAPSGSTLMRALRAYRTHGASGLIDDYHKCGNRSGIYNVEENLFYAKAARDATREERPPLAQTLQRIMASVRRENARRRAATPREKKLSEPGRDKLRSVLAATGHVEYILRTKGPVAAARDGRPVGEGPKADRALQTVVMDEWCTDIKTLVSDGGLWDWLSDAQRESLMKKGKPIRIWLSAAIDLATRSILSLQFALAPSANLTLRALEMMLMDKTGWADAVDSRLPWPMQGLPEGIVMDRGPSYRNRLVYLATDQLRINYMGCVAEMPSLKGVIERFFRTAHERVVSRLGGRTFTHVHARGGYDSDQKARLTPEQFIKAFLRFVIDIHHSSKHPALDGRTPLQAWNAQMETGFAPRRPPDTRTMRMVFGTHLTRKLTPKGLKVAGIAYQTERLARLYLARPGRKCQLRWWPHDVGAIEVKIGVDEWMTVMACEQRFLGKSIEEARPWLFSGPIDPETQDIQDQAFGYIDGLDPGAAAIAELFESTWTEKRVGRFEDGMVRHMVTAERTLRLGEARPLLADEILPLPEAASVVGPPASLPRADQPPVADPGDYTDLLE